MSILAPTENLSHQGSFRQHKPLWIIYAVGCTGLLINLVYFVSESIWIDDPRAHFWDNLSEHVLVASLIVIFPVLAFFIDRVMAGYRRGERSHLLELEVAARTRELEDLKSFSENIMASVNDMIFVIGSDGRFQFVSGNSRKVLGKEPEELMGRQFSDMVATGSVARAVSNFEKVMWGQDVPAYELEMTGGNGGTRFIEISGTPYRDGDSVIAQVGVAREITERKQLQQHIQERNRELAALHAVAHAVAQSLDLDQVLDSALARIVTLLGADRAWVHLYEQDTGELSLQVWKGSGEDSEIVKTAKRLKLGRRLSEMAAGNGFPVSADVDDLMGETAQALRKDGNESIKAVPMTVGGRLVGILGVASAESDHFQTADLDLLRVASSHVAMAIENAKLYEDIKYKTNELEAQNRELAEATGKIGNLISSAERQRSFGVRYDNQLLVKCWEAKHCTFIECPSYESENLRCWQVAGTHCGGEVQGVFAQKLGRCEKCEVYQAARADRIAALGETFNNMMAMLEEKVEEREQLQEQLIQSTKLAAIGELAANIAHEINNPLTGVLGFASLMLRDCPEGDARKHGLETIERETLRARDIVRNLLDFARQDGLKQRQTDIRDVVDDTRLLLRRQAELAGIEVSQSFADDVPQVYVDANQMKQVFINILNNALHAMPDGGKLGIDIHAAKPDSQKPWVEIAFRDTGVGIPPDKLGRVFDPFFTSKDVGEGTGLGLSVSQRIVEEHGGAIVVESQVGHGSTFTVKLPTAKMSAGFRRVA